VYQSVCLLITGHNGRQSFKKARIVVAVEIKEGDYGLGRIRIQHVPDFSAMSLVPFVIQPVEEGSIVETDGWRGYNPIGEMGSQRKKDKYLVMV
jgi:transposase-like protein